ncbi:MAG: ABC transporter substrate-binding protein [Chloroflexi bacterium]|nr:ABC transporter substrate-binding protein [Chloroflexota bacterium]
MKGVITAFLAVLLALGLLVVACAKPAPPPTSAPAPIVTTVPTSTPKTSPTPTVAPAQTPQYGGVLRTIQRQPPRGMYPPLQHAGQVTFPAFQSLVRYDDKANLVSELAADWKFGPDFKSLTFTLRKGIKFHDGTDFNAAAAKFVLEKRKAGRFGDLDNVTSVSVIDDYTIRLDLSSFQNTIMLYMVGDTSIMYSPTAVQRMGEEWALWNPVGTGPFKFVSYQRDALVKYERFDGYWEKGKPYLDGVEILIIADPTTGTLAFKKGDVHAIREVMMADVMDLKQYGDYNMTLLPTNQSTLVPDTANPDSPFANKKVREAVDYALDSQAINKSLGYGMWDAPKQIAASYMPAHVRGLGRQYDPAKAKQLLAEAGYPNGFKTTLYSRTVAPQDAIVAAASFLKAVGIDATSSPLDIGRYAQLSENGWKNSLLVGSLTTTGDPVPVWLRSIASNLSTTVKVHKSWTRPSGFQETLEQALAAAEPDAQKTLSQKLVRMIYDDAALINPYTYSRGYIWTKNVQNGDFLGEGNAKWTVADAWIRK